LVDVWAIYDQNNLDWIRSHQSNIRSDLYRGLEDALIREDVDVVSLGRRFILPSRFTGGPRFMAIVRHYFFQNYLIFNISRSFERSQFNLASDYLHMFKMNSFIYWDHYLTEV
jgi:hypothetical protein